MAVLLGILGTGLVAAGLWDVSGWSASAVFVGVVLMLVAWYGDALPALPHRRRQSDD